MFSEGILVRLIVPAIGEVNSIRLGLLGFSMQSFIVAMSTTQEWIFISVLFSMISNLVYPSISSLVSKVVDEEVQGEAQGALNGIRALTEGFGPLFFGVFMSLFEKSSNPGAPYFIASILSLWALLHCYELPNEPNSVVLAKLAAKRDDNDEHVSLLHKPRGNSFSLRSSRDSSEEEMVIQEELKL